MNYQKTLLGIALIIVVLAIIIGAKSYLTISEKSPRVVRPPEVKSLFPESKPIQDKTSQTESTLLESNPNSTNIVAEITFSGEWVPAKFPYTEYHHSMNIMLPSSWIFDCCGDTDSFSAHYIYPSSSADNLEASPHIVVYDFAESGCINGEIGSCTIGESKILTSNQFMIEWGNFLKSNDWILLKSVRETGSAKLKNFTKEAIIYNGISPSNQQVDLYMVQWSEGVIGVAFHQPQSFSASFKAEFLNKITTN